MPTQPIASLLDRDLSRVAARELTSVTRPLLQELVNNGTNVLARCEASVTGGENEDLAALALYLHMLQMTDGVEALVYEGCIGAAIPCLRSSFEGLLGLKYILQKDYARRSLAWFAGMLLGKVAYSESIDVTNPKARPAREALGSGTLGQIASQVKDDIKRWNAVLAEPAIRDIAAEVRRVKKWYAAFGGPKSLQQLARHLGMEAAYELLYRHWSSVTHAGDLFRFLTRTTKGEYGIKPLRDLADLRQIADLSAWYLLEATRVMIEKYRAGEDLKPWYLREVRPLSAKLNPSLPDLDSLAEGGGPGD